MEKQCKRCGVIKAATKDEFRIRKLPSGNLWMNTICRECERADNREYQKAYYRPVVHTELTCPNCKQVKPASEFHQARKGNWCKECKNHYARDYYRRRSAEDPTYGRVQSRNATLRKHGLSPEDYDRMVGQQDGKCAICGKSPGETDGVDRYRLVIDHNHATGKVRALLCDFCNRGLGIFFDDPDLMVAAATYVRRFKEVMTPS